MDIVDIKIRKVIQEGRLRAVVSVTFGNNIVIHDIKLVQGDDRLFVAMPNRRDETGTYRDIVHPINKEARIKLENHIVEAYLEHVKTEECRVAAIAK